MDNFAWVAILRHIPADKLSGFTIVLTGNIEITLQSLLRFENEFVVVKGRLSGSQEAGRIFFVPYYHIINLGSMNPMKDEEYEAMFGELTIPTSPTFSAPAYAVTPTAMIPEPMAVTSQPTSNGYNGGQQVDSGVRAAIRSEVLERFRSRSPAPSSSANLPNPRQT